MKRKLFFIFGLFLPWSSAFAVPVLEGDDAIWETTGATISFEVLAVSGSINAADDLDFGVYDATNSDNRISLFSDGISVGDTNTQPSDVGVRFGFYLSNVGTSFGGSYTLFSDSTFNPAIPGFVDAGLDAMFADVISADTFTVEWEDVYLPIRPGIGTDLMVRVSGARNAAIPEPTSLALLGLGALVLLRKHRLK